jgi:hypothetical protein
VLVSWVGASFARSASYAPLVQCLKGWNTDKVGRLVNFNAVTGSFSARLRTGFKHEKGYSSMQKLVCNYISCYVEMCRGAADWGEGGILGFRVIGWFHAFCQRTCHVCVDGLGLIDISAAVVMCRYILRGTQSPSPAWWSPRCVAVVEA